MDTTATPLNILVVEDNENLRESIADALQLQGHHVRAIDCAEALPEQGNLTQLDLAILDLNLPGDDGIHLAARLRKTQPALGIIMLTARTQSEERAAGYAAGADIYLTKPASLKELEYAIASIARRMKLGLALHPAQAIRVSPVQRTLVFSDGRCVSLTENESTLLVAFSRAFQNTLETWQIAEILGMALNKPAIELHMVRLRKKLPVLDGDGSPIQAVRGLGYRLCTVLHVV